VSDLNEIKLDRVYTNGGQFYRPIGWLGQNSVVFEEVKIYHDNRGFNFFYTARKVKGRRVYQETLTRFSEKYRVPTAVDLKNGAVDA
jgi:hypothetical protein